MIYIYIHTFNIQIRIYDTHSKIFAYIYIYWYLCAHIEVNKIVTNEYIWNPEMIYIHFSFNMLYNVFYRMVLKLSAAFSSILLTCHHILTFYVAFIWHIVWRCMQERLLLYHWNKTDIHSSSLTDMLRGFFKSRILSEILLGILWNILSSEYCVILSDILFGTYTRAQVYICVY